MTDECSDAKRIRFLIENRGMEEALDFARRTYRIYRGALLSAKFNFAQTKEYRPKFILSCVLHKRFYEGKIKFINGEFI